MVAKPELKGWGLLNARWGIFCAILCNRVGVHVYIWVSVGDLLLISRSVPAWDFFCRWLTMQRSLFTRKSENHQCCWEVFFIYIYWLCLSLFICLCDADKPFRYVWVTPCVYWCQCVFPRQIGCKTTLYPDISISTINKEWNAMGGFVLSYGEIVLFGRIYFKERKSLQSNLSISKIWDN